MITEWTRSIAREASTQRKNSPGRRKAAREGIGRMKGPGGEVPRHGAGARREENRMARGGMRGRRWAFRGPAMITGSASP